MSTMEEIVEQEPSLKGGEIHLVGAGPGNPRMLTVGAIDILNKCDLVVSDRLIPQAILLLIDSKKLILSSFKVGGKSDESQDQSNEICLKAVSEGKVVVRLKTGDPFLYGRGGEEILFFRNHGYEPSIVPGLSSVFAAPTSCLIPVTHRDVADQVLVLSGRGKGGTFPQIPEYLDTRTTIFLMSLSRVKELVDLMLEMKYPLGTPCAVIQKGTWEDEKIVSSNLNDIVIALEDSKIVNPAMLVVGNVCSVLRGRDMTNAIAI